jgi:DNA mismatch repair protein MutS
MSNVRNDITPLMAQYLKIKAQYKDAILLYRMGDFYETFYEDAKIISKLLGIALTKRAHGKSAHVPLAGFPYHALDNYLHKLVQAGKRIAICEQIEDPKTAKTVVKREVIEIVTPGVTYSDKILDTKSNNFLASVYIESNKAGLSYVDISTGEFNTSEFEILMLVEQLLSISPKEILIAGNQKEQFQNLFKTNLDTLITERDEWIYTKDYARDVLINHFKVHSLKGFDLENYPLALITAGSSLNYLQENYKSHLDQIQKIHVRNLSKYMVLDESTRRNLEINYTLRENIGGNTLLEVIDKTKTAMGGRLMRQWLNFPLCQASEIKNRLDIVDELFNNQAVLIELKKLLKECSDIERLITKIASGRANGRDLVYLKNTLTLIPEIKKIIQSSALKKLIKAFNGFKNLPDIIKIIDDSITDNPPITIMEGGLIKRGYSKELDEIFEITSQGKEWLLDLQEKEKQRTGINTLKLNFNKVFGYYIEITKSNYDKIPENYIRKQTLVNAERFITPELKEKEEKILNAEDRVKSLEYEIFNNVRQQITSKIYVVQNNSRLLAELDCYCSFALVAEENHYVKPDITTKNVLKIKKGRHPVVEKFMKPGEEFIANDVNLDPGNEQIWILTGPNMAGKSTYLRQVGLTVFLAQLGCFVPADEAKIGIVDRIFTRVGASDNLASGESTFLVEMNETANILNNASSKSLLLLDEIGRGTSTFDGLAIAWSVAEYIHNNKNVKAKTLFATHYHELTELSNIYSRIKNYNVLVEEWEDQVIFLRKIVQGGTDNSYGIHVAQMAGLPKSVIERAREILTNLETKELNPHSLPGMAKRKSGRAVDENQLSLFKDKEGIEIKKKIQNIDINNLTPIEALNKLDELKKLFDK